MSNITAKLVKELRDKTGAGMMDCKKALNETDGDVQKLVNGSERKALLVLRRNQVELPQKVLLVAIFTQAQGLEFFLN